jgi:hypothetical protein
MVPLVNDFHRVDIAEDALTELTVFHWPARWLSFCGIQNSQGDHCGRK